MRNFKFIKELNDRWYIDLPEWKGDKDELEMVCGADTLLDILSQGESSVYVSFSLEPVENYKYKLTLITEEYGGGLYTLEGEYHDFNVWLCHVTKFVFGELPNYLYII